MDNRIQTLQNELHNQAISDDESRYSTILQQVLGMPVGWNYSRQREEYNILNLHFVNGTLNRPQRKDFHGNAGTSLHQELAFRAASLLFDYDFTQLTSILASSDSPNSLPFESTDTNINLLLVAKKLVDNLLNSGFNNEVELLPIAALFHDRGKNAGPTWTLASANPNHDGKLENLKLIGEEDEDFDEELHVIDFYNRLQNNSYTAEVAILKTMHERYVLVTKYIKGYSTDSTFLEQEDTFLMNSLALLLCTFDEIVKQGSHPQNNEKKELLSNLLTTQLSKF